MRNIANFILFQASWWMIAYSVINNLFYAAIVVTVIALAIHLFILSRTFFAEIAAMLVVTILGVAMDFGFSTFGGFTLSSFREAPFQLPGGFPIWLICLWLLFSTTFLNSLFWISFKLRLSMILGALGGAGTYFAAEQMGVLEFSEPKFVYLLVYAVLWAIVFPLQLNLTKKIRQAIG